MHDTVAITEERTDKYLAFRLTPCWARLYRVPGLRCGRCFQSMLSCICHLVKTDS